MLEEPPILGRKDRRDQMGRDGGEGDGLVEPSHAESAQDLRLQLDLGQAPPVGGADVDDASPVEAEARLEGWTGRPRVVARPEEDVPLALGPAEPSGGRGGRGRLFVPEATEGAGEIGRLDRHARADRLARPVQHGGILVETGEIDGRHRPQRPGGQSEQGNPTQPEHQGGGPTRIPAPGSPEVGDGDEGRIQPA